MCCFPSSEVGDSVTNSAVSVPLSDTELSLKCFCTLSLSGFVFVFFSLLHILAMWSAEQSLEQRSSKIDVLYQAEEAFLKSF